MNGPILLEILNSQRLLSDHVEILEQLLIELNLNEKDSSGNSLHLLKFTPICAASITANVFWRERWPYMDYVTASILSGYSTFCLFRLYKKYCEKTFRKQINTLLTAINGFDSCIRRNLAYFREAALLNANVVSILDQSSHEICLAQKTTENILKIIRLLADNIYKLETWQLPEKYDNSYENLGNIDECDRMHQTMNNGRDSSHLKELYNIFLYIQSQFFTRLGLALIYNANESQTFVRNVVPKLIKTIQQAIQQDDSLQKSLTDIGPVDTKLKIFRSQNSVSEPLTMLRSYSLSLTSRMLAIADGCRKIDGSIQDIAAKSHTERDCVPSNFGLIKLTDSLRLLEDAIMVGHDDFKRLQLAFYKYFHHPSDALDQQQRIENPIEQVDEGKKSKIILNANDVDDVNREFFAQVDLSKIDLDESKVDAVAAPGGYLTTSLADELNQMNSKMVRRQFKPVLQQLKTKISPIKQSMQTRELNYLRSKGLPHDFDDKQVNYDDESMKMHQNDDTDDDDDDLDKRKLQKKRIETMNRFDEMRKFLETKEQINLTGFHLQIPAPNPALSEEEFS